LILLLIALISATTAYQGEIVNLTLDETATVTLDDCMYFTETLQNSSTLPAGTHQIKITHSCLGSYFIEVKTNSSTESIPLKVERDPNPQLSLESMDGEILRMHRQMQSLQDQLSYYKKLFEVVNSMNVELYERVQTLVEENNKLLNELNMFKEAAGNCSRLVENLRLRMNEMNYTINELQQRNKALESNLSSVETKLSSAISNYQLFQTLFCVTMSFLVGAAFALLRR